MCGVSGLFRVCESQQVSVSRVERRIISFVFVGVASGDPDTPSGSSGGSSLVEVLVEVLVALGICAQLRVNGWICRELEEYFLVQYVKVVNSWNNDSAVLEDLGAVNVVRLWLSRTDCRPV